ncbi:MAG: hypothetical protein FWH08_00550 [Oscillospiraceae bacterium]|nr:hypothetical protein [Oscillospiraceae bacterium]
MKEYLTPTYEAEAKYNKEDCRHIRGSETITDITDKETMNLVKFRPNVI